MESSSSSAEIIKWEVEFRKILQKISGKKDSEFFKMPVDWEALGITDYPLIIKQPMDLGTISKKLESSGAKAYKTAEEAANDMRLVWSNAMLYNAPGSKIYQSAKNLGEYWESQWAQVVKDDPDRPPSTDEAAALVDMCHRLTSEEMGKLLNIIDSLCPHCLSKKVEANEIEVNIDIISGRAFRAAQAFMAQTLPDTVTTRRRLKRSTDEPQASTKVEGSTGTSSSAKKNKGERL